MDGRLVLVRTYNGELVVRVLLRLEPQAAFVCKQERYEEIASGQIEPPMVGFPIEDVFEYDETGADAVRSGQPCDWSQFKPLKA